MIPQETSFLEKIAQDYEVLVAGERNGSHITYQYSEKQFLDEFYDNHFVDAEHQGDIVTDFYYKGKRITNFKTFPNAYNTDCETIYDVVAYINKINCLKAWNQRKRVFEINDKEQLPGQTNIFDYLKN